MKLGIQKTKITTDSDCSHEIKRHLLLGRKVMTNLDSILESSSNCCFLTCIQFSQEAGKVVWCSRLFKNFPQFVVIHIVTGFSTVKEAEVDIFLEFSCIFYDPMDVEI